MEKVRRKGGNNSIFCDSSAISTQPETHAQGLQDLNAQDPTKRRHSTAWCSQLIPHLWAVRRVLCCLSNVAFATEIIYNAAADTASWH